MTGPRSRIPPLNINNPIVDPQTGVPTPQFMRLWQQLFGNEVVTAGEAETALADATDALTRVQTLEGRNINTGFGLSGGGDLSADRTLSLGNPALADPGADRGLFWDDSAGQLDWLTFGSGLTLTGTTLTAAGGGGLWYFNPPLAADFPTSLNSSGDSTLLTLSNDTDIGMILDGGTANLTGNRHRIRYKTLPSGDWSVDVRLGLNSFNANIGIFISLIQTSTNRTANIGSFLNTTDPSWQLWRSSDGTLNSYTALINNSTYKGYVGFLRLEKIGSNFRISLSSEGKNFVEVGTFTSAALGFTADPNAIGPMALSGATTGRRILGFIDRWVQSW